VLKMSRYMGIIRQKQQQNGWKTKGLEEKPERPRTRRRTAVPAGRTTVRPPHRRPCIPPQAARGGPCLARSDASSTQRFALPLDLGLGLGSSCFGPPLQLYLIYMALNFIYRGFNSHISPKNLACIIQICNQHSTSQNQA